MTLAVHLVDGPAVGSYETAFESAPSQLQAVTSTIDGAAAVLDLPTDAPALGENVHTYERLGAGHRCGRRCETVFFYQLTKEDWQSYTPLRAVPDRG